MMKSKKILFLTTLLGLSTSIVSCGGSTDQGGGGNMPAPYVPPTTKYEKVRTALSGVEASFQYASYHQLNTPKARRSDEQGLADLFALFTSSDIQGTSIEDLSYDQPPMIQFQYLKKVIETVGESYSFGEKYYDTITGSVYVDMETGYEAEEEENKYNYTFVLALEVDINNNDLITADVSFDITLAKNENRYTSKWYVSMLLDYDMEKQLPNYTLKMITDNDEKNLPYRDEHVYEYDYVEVRDSTIKEWRKFCLSASEKLERNQAHPTFESYVDEIEYNVDCFAWYKNGYFYKNNNLKDEKRLAFGEGLFSGLCLNSTDINPEAFFNKEGTVNSKIKTIYNQFSQIYGKDIIYDLVTREEDEGGGGQHGDIGDLADIHWTTNDESVWNFPNSVVLDTDIRTLFNEPTSWAENLYPKFKFVDENGGEIMTTSDLTLFNMYLILEFGSASAAKYYEIDEYTRVIDLFKGTAQMDLTLLFEYKEDTNFTLELQISNYITKTKSFPDFPSIKFEASGWGEYFPDMPYIDEKYLIAPGYTSGEMQLLDTTSENESVCIVKAYATNYMEMNRAYSDLLHSYGFEEGEENGTATSYKYDEELDGTFKVYYRFDVQMQCSEICFTFKHGKEGGGTPGPDPDVPTKLLKDAIAELTQYRFTLPTELDVNYVCTVEGVEIIPYEIDASVTKSIFTSLLEYGSPAQLVYKDNGDVYAFGYEEGMFTFVFLYFSQANNTIRAYNNLELGREDVYFICGDMTTWNLDNRQYAFLRFTNDDNGISSEITLPIEEGQGFKVVHNSWEENGGYGYKSLRGNDKGYFYNGNDENITANQSGTYTFRITIDLTSENELIFRSITLIKAQVDK